MITAVSISCAAILAYVLSYYGWARSRPTPDSFVVEYDSKMGSRMRHGLEAIHKPLIWLDGTRYMRVYQLPPRPILDPNDLQSVDRFLVTSQPTREDKKP